MPDVDPALTALLNAPPDPQRPYVYRGTRSRINKFGILNPQALDLVVRATSELRAQLLKAQPLEGAFDLDHLCRIHHDLFQDAYPWAGELRIVDFNKDPVGEAAERTLPFAAPDQIVANSTQVLRQLADERHLRDLDLATFTDRLTHYFHRLAVIHPFRDGNGRTLREFFSQLAAAAGYAFDFAAIPQCDRHWVGAEADRGNDEPLRRVFRRAIAPLAPAAQPSSRGIEG